ncbi:hypothetical protein SH1V18_17310 [Vallitalea longa]|uniref:PPC domain-containing protein n=1 Tax=Vallitalea longa TaxID=2936439 RepID=A0A9W6DDQ3_9FIRM|nr:PPC domain-containing DNA-binding protein [Vallitalea longa]GKX29251.1 hypothetical protein SH1V18_17310 [Vallitalea longa]
MEYKKFGNKYVIRFDRGEEIVDSLAKLCKKEKINLGSVSAIGAASEVTLGIFNTLDKSYNASTLKGDHEITSIVGNISTMDGEVYLHLHINVSNHAKQVFGGHLNSAIVSATCEMIVDVIDGEVDRKFSDEIGLNLFEV